MNLFKAKTPEQKASSDMQNVFSKNNPRYN